MAWTVVLACVSRFLAPSHLDLFGNGNVNALAKVDKMGATSSFLTSYTVEEPIAFFALQVPEIRPYARWPHADPVVLDAVA